MRGHNPGPPPSMRAPHLPRLPGAQVHLRDLKASFPCSITIRLLVNCFSAKQAFHQPATRGSYSNSRRDLASHTAPRCAVLFQACNHRAPPGAQRDSWREGGDTAPQRYSLQPAFCPDQRPRTNPTWTQAQMTTPCHPEAPGQWFTLEMAWLCGSNFCLK